MHLRPIGSREACNPFAVAVILAVVIAGPVSGGPSPATAASDVAWRDYEDPSSTVTMQVPASWRAGKQAERGASRVVTFKLPDAGAELTLAIQPDLKRANELPASLARSYFPPDAVVESPRTSRGKGWLGLRQEAKATVGGKERAYVGQFFVFRSTLVAVLLSDDPARIGEQREIFDRVALSIRYHEPAVDTARGEGAPCVTPLAATTIRGRPEVLSVAQNLPDLRNPQATIR